MQNSKFLQVKDNWRDQLLNWRIKKVTIWLFDWLSLNELVLLFIDTLFFISNAFFFNSASLLINFSWIELQMLLRCCLVRVSIILLKHCIFTIFLSMSRPTIMFIIFRDFLMVEQIFLSPQVKRSVIISNKLVFRSCQTTSDLGC